MAFAAGLEEQLNREYPKPKRSTSQWVAEITAAVVKALVTGYKIDAARLKPYGVRPLAPVTSNGTENERAKNRRIELVAQ